MSDEIDGMYDAHLPDHCEALRTYRTQQRVSYVKH